MDIPHKAWVLILDGEKFLMLRNEGGRELTDLRVIGHDEIDNPPTSEQGTDRPGIMPDVGEGRSAVEQTDWHALEKKRFAADIAGRLFHWAIKNRFSQLIIAADPKTLGVLRKGLHKEVQDRTVGDLDKDLTNMPIEEIEAALKAA